MQLICSRTALVEAISMVQRAIAIRSTNPILEGILLDAEDRLTLTGYDLETGIEAILNCDVKEKGKVVLRSKMFGDIIRKLPEEDVLIESQSDFKVNITSGNAKFTIHGLDAMDYPEIPIVEESQKVQLKQSILKSMIEQTIFAVSTDESRPLFNGIKVCIRQDKIELVAIDGFRLAVRSEEIESKTDNLDFIVPGRAMGEVARTLSDSEETVALYLSHNHILFETQKVRLVSRLIKGEFMDYERIIPGSFTTQMVVNARQVLNAIERAALVINVEQRRFPVTLETPETQKMKISARTDLGYVEELIDVDMKGESIDIDFNPKYFLDALSKLGDENVRIEFSGANYPCVIRPLEGEKFLYLLLPLRR